MKRDAGVYFEDIIKALERIETFIAGMSLADFRSDFKTQDAVIKNFEIIGEAVKRIPEDLKQKYPNIPWRSASGMRDFLIHDYPDIIPDVVWTTATDNLPAFKIQIQQILNTLPKAEK